MTPKCPDCGRDQDECSCSNEIESLRAQITELKAENERLNKAAVILRATIKCQQHWQEERDELKRQNAELAKDAERYRWIRRLHWSDGTLTVTHPRNVHLGSTCLSLDLLDDAIDASMKGEQS